jgi:HSP20 family molecular chaperone IbpA
MKLLGRDISMERLFLAAIMVLQLSILGYLFLVTTRIRSEKEALISRLDRHIQAERIAATMAHERPTFSMIAGSSLSVPKYGQSQATHDEMDRMLQSLFGAAGRPSVRAHSHEGNLFQLAGFPIDSIARSHNNMLRLFDSAFEDFRRASEALAPGGEGDSLMISPAMDMREFDDCYVVAMSLPAADKPDISVILDGQILSVQGRHEGQQGESWQFEKYVRLPGPVELKSVRATLTNGVLRIMAPKTENTRTDDKPSRIM